MKYIPIIATILMASTHSVYGQEILGGDASVANVRMDKTSDKMYVSMDIIPTNDWNVKSNQSIVLTPAIENGGNSLQLPQVKILGRNAYIRNQRKSDDKDANSQAYKASKTQAVHYETSVAYEKWMDNSVLVLGEDLCGCCKTLLSSNKDELEQYKADFVFTPVYAYIVPEKEAIKARSESGQAYVTFHVSKTDIDNYYLNNQKELQKIMNSIALVREDKDVTITGIQLKGYASPEGKFQDNERLAKGRTEAVAGYVRNLSGNVDYTITTSHEAENWEGLRAYISQSNLPEKEQLLEIIDSPSFADNPDGREWKIKSTYPDAYRTLLRDCYPSLRRTDYLINYNVRAFNLEEAKALIGSQPQKLSLQEMYNVAQTYEPGSDAYNEVFNTAVRMFPNDPVANLNAANSAMQRKDLVMAEKYLAKAGDSGEATLARGILAMLKGDTETATTLMSKAKDMGVEAAASNLNQVSTISK